MTDGLAIDLGDWFRSNAAEAQKNLGRYFDGKKGDLFTGRHFEPFAAMGDPFRFQPSDVLAIEALSVEVPPESAARLLITEADHFNEHLAEIPPNKDLWEVPRSVVEDGNPAADLHTRLRGLHYVGSVTAGKLMAAKRPNLIPILDSFVEEELKPPKGRFWVTLYDQLSDEPRRRMIAEVCSCAPDNVSLLRRIDVAVWMHVWVRRSARRQRKDG